MSAPIGLLDCGNRATLSLDKSVVARPQRFADRPLSPPISILQIIVFKGLTDFFYGGVGVADALLSSMRLSQVPSERS